MTSFKFSVNGLEAAPQGSKKYIGKGRMIEVSKRVKPWRELVRSEASKIKQPPMKVLAMWRPLLGLGVRRLIITPMALSVQGHLEMLRFEEMI